MEHHHITLNAWGITVGKKGVSVYNPVCACLMFKCAQFIRSYRSSLSHDSTSQIAQAFIQNIPSTLANVNVNIVELIESKAGLLLKNRQFFTLEANFENDDVRSVIKICHFTQHDLSLFTPFISDAPTACRVTRLRRRASC